jgi:hypothetical protein
MAPEAASPAHAPPAPQPRVVLAAVDGAAREGLTTRAVVHGTPPTTLVTTLVTENTHTHTPTPTHTHSLDTIKLPLLLMMLIL